MSPADRKLLKACKGRVDVETRVEDAIRRGANANCRDEYNLTPFMWCARKGHIAAARALVAADAEIEARGNVRRTAIHHAVLFGRLEFIDYLIRIGVDVNAREMHGFSALDLALSQAGLKPVFAQIVAILGAAGAAAPKHPKYNRAPV